MGAVERAVIVAGTLVDLILQRVRDNEGVIATRGFVRSRISDGQRLLNARFGWVLDSATLVTEPARLFYPITPLLPEAQRVWYIKQATRNLSYVPWRTFSHMEQGWPRAMGSRYETWTRIGFDTVLVWPGVPVTTSLTIESSKITANLTGDTDPLEVPDDVVPLVTDLATVLVSLKMRQLSSIDEVMKTLMGRLKERSLEVAA